MWELAQLVRSPTVGQVREYLKIKEILFGALKLREPKKLLPFSDSGPHRASWIKLCCPMPLLTWRFKAFLSQTLHFP